MTPLLLLLGCACAYCGLFNVRSSRTWERALRCGCACAGGGSVAAWAMIPTLCLGPALGNFFPPPQRPAKGGLC